MTARARIVVIAVLILAQIGIGSTAAYRHVAHSKSSGPEMPQRGDANPSEAADMLQTARAEAKVWKPDAALITDVTWLSWPVTAPDPNQMAAPVNGWGTFVFASGGERLAIVVDRGSGFILGMHPKSFGLAATGTLDPMNPTITAETALVTAELLGGREYRAACPEHRDQTKVGAAKDPKTGRLTWVVTYADDRSSSLPDIIVIVDATTGAVEQKTINLPSCEQS